MSEELNQKIREAVISQLDIDDDTLAELTDDMHLFKIGDGEPDIGLDSIDTLEIVTAIYKEWEFDVPVEEVKRLYSVNAIAQYLTEKGVA